MLLDLRMPGVDGLALQKELGAFSETFPIVMISGHADMAKAAQSLRGGARAFLSKPFTRQDLCDAVLNAFSWKNDVHARFRMGEVAREKFAKLDERESALLRIFANGQSEQTASYLLNLTMDEVDLCRENIFKKFEVDRMENAVRIFFEGNAVFSEGDHLGDPRFDSMLFSCK